MTRIGRYRKSLANGLLVHKLLQLLARAGVVIEPYNFYIEPAMSPDGGETGEFEFFEAGPADTAGIAALDPNGDPNDEIPRSFQEGRRCFALRRGDRIVAATWCNVDEINFDPCHRPLRPEEAYLYGSETLHEYRGHNLAPRLRALAQAKLRAEGRRLVYSYTDRFNRPALRFKEKIGARVLFRGLFVKVFGLVLINRGPHEWASAVRPGTSLA